MIIAYQGQDYEFDVRSVTVDEWRELKRKYKMTPGQFEDAIDEADPDASTFLLWIMLRRAGQHAMPLGDHLKPDIIELNAAIAQARSAELKARAAEADAGQEPEAQPDPTRAHGSPAQSPSPPAAPSRSRRPREAATGS